MKQRWGLDRNVLRPTLGDPWSVEQHHWNTGAKENQQLNACYGKSPKCLVTMYTIVMSVVKEDDSFLWKLFLVIHKGVDNDTPGHNAVSARIFSF